MNTAHDPGPARTLPAVMSRLIAASETLAALTVHLAHVSGEAELDPETARRVSALAAAVVDLDNVDPALVRTQSAFGRAMLSQAAAFAATPTEPSSWAVTDPLVLQSLGRGSSAFAPLIVRQIAPAIPGFVERISSPGTRVLDVGVGVGALAIAFAEQLPSATVVGLDVWDPAIELARQNVRSASLEGRVEIRRQDVVALDDDLGFDLVWFAGPFIPAAVQPPALARCVASMRHGGWLVYGAYGGGDPLSAALSDLRTLRSGGPVLSDEDIANLLRTAGLADVQEAAVPVGLPARLVIGRAP